MKPPKKRGRAAQPSDRKERKVMVRMSGELHAKLAKLSDKYQISLNRIAINLLNDYVEAQKET